MLQPAIKYKEKLSELFINTWVDDKYKFYYNSFHVIPEIPISDFETISFVSLNNTNQITGFIAFGVNREGNYIESMSAINFTENKATFGLDLLSSLKNLFEINNFRKIDFTVTVGNPIEKSYDKYIMKYGGRIVGVKKQHVLINGKYYDHKIYEITKQEYELNKLKQYEKRN